MEETQENATQLLNMYVVSASDLGGSMLSLLIGDVVYHLHTFEGEAANKVLGGSFVRLTDAGLESHLALFKAGTSTKKYHLESTDAGLEQVLLAWAAVKGFVTSRKADKNTLKALRQALSIDLGDPLPTNVEQ